MGRICGGGATNVVADICDVYYESRRHKAKLERITTEIIEHFRAGGEAAEGKVTAEVSPDYGPYSLATDSLAIHVASTAAPKSLASP